MPPPARFRRNEVPSEPFEVQLSSHGYSPCTAEVDSNGVIHSLQTWKRIMEHFGIVVTGTHLAPCSDANTSAASNSEVSKVLIARMMSLIVDGRSGFAVDVLKANNVYLFDLVAAKEMFSENIATGSSAAVTGTTQLRDVQPVGFVFDKRMLLHEAADCRIPEAPVRVERAYAALCAHPLIGHVLNAHEIPPRAASVEEIVLVHDEAVYRPFLEGSAPLASVVTAPLKSDVYTCEATANAVRLACGASIDACRWVWDSYANAASDSGRQPLSAFCLIRPPGHHCSRDTPSGFCIANNAVVAARNLQVSAANEGKGPLRVAIVDLDVHHGEGTQALVEDDPSILYLSTHRYDSGHFYPCGPAGAASHVGPHHTIVNIPFDTSAADPTACHAVMSDYALVQAWERIMRPQLEAFAPQLIVVSLGFDASYGDPLGRMSVEGGFAVVLRRLMQWCSSFSFLVSGGAAPCRGVVCLLEGGYQPSVVATRSCECFEALLTWQDRGLSPEEQSINNFPKTWSDVRSKSQRKQHERQVAAEENRGASPTTTGTEEISADCSGGPTAHIDTPPSDLTLWERHLEWVDGTLHRVIEERLRCRASS